MIPAFQLLRPDTIDEASLLLEQHGDEGALYAGGTELLLVMKLGFADYSILIDVKNLPELTTLASPAGGPLIIGGAVTHRRLERSPEVRERWPALGNMISTVANVRVRSIGTLGGNLCFADPHSDPATFLLAADAVVIIQRYDATVRRLPLDRFILGMFETALEPSELLTTIEVPALRKGAAMAHQKFAVHERPNATVACHLRLNGLQLTDVRIAVGSVGPRPMRVSDSEQLLDGVNLAELEAGLLKEVARIAARTVEPIDDDEGSAAYKSNLVAVLIQRAVRRALSTAVSTVPSAASALQL